MKREEISASKYRREREENIDDLFVELKEKHSLLLNYVYGQG